ncbi:MAG TPA: Gfo/Idh/MocA family oxidoreductase [Anaerovoracaceae bacterium]|nr:Gfo/Idh/MocA family oxidoreductase [Anaerovoracaceae bacterium]
MLRIGIVGAGGMGTVHKSNYAYMKDCQVVAVVGQTRQDEERAKEWGLPLYRDVDSMLDQEEIDVVDVCTPTFLHKEHVMKALARKKHTLTEKPVALKASDAKEMFDLARENGVQLFVGQVLRFYRESQILKELVDDQRYGKVLDATFERLSACPRWAQGGWLFDKSKSGHLPFDLHIHDLDLMVSLFGKPEDFSFTSCGNRGKDYKEQYRFFYQYKGFNVVAEAAWFNAEIPFTARWRVYFENAVVINDGTGMTAYQFDHEPLVFDTEEKIKIPTGINVPPTGVYLEELEHFMSCIRNNRSSERVKEDGIMAVIEILEQISKES